MNNIGILVQAFRNPSEFMNQVMQNSQLMQNPIAKNTIEMMQKGDRKGTEETARCMKLLSETGRYEVSSEVMEKIKENFVGYFADEDETATTLRKTYNDFGYLADTHTSVALNCAEKYINATNDTTPMVVVSTASPYKFAADVYKSITKTQASDGTAALDELSSLTNTEISYPLKNLDTRKVNFYTVIETQDMLEAVYKFM